MEGSTKSTSSMEITVPLPIQLPMVHTTGWAVRFPIRKPAEAIIVPEVNTVGNAAFRA